MLTKTTTKAKKIIMAWVKAMSKVTTKRMVTEIFRYDIGEHGRNKSRSVGQSRLSSQRYHYYHHRQHQSDSTSGRSQRNANVDEQKHQISSTDSQEVIFDAFELIEKN